MQTTPVTQKHPMACGLACVSFVTKIPYDQLAASEPMTKLSRDGFLCPELVNLLKNAGYNYGWKKLAEHERDSEFNLGDIVFIEPSASHPGGHFLAKAEGGWMNPWINYEVNRPIVAEATSGFQKVLPGKAEYIVYKLN